MRAECDLIFLAWDRPANTPPEEVIEYEIRVEDAAGEWVDSADIVRTTEGRLPRLPLGFTYGFRVAARAVGGDQEWKISPALEHFLPDVPMSPSDLVITPGASNERCDSIELLLPKALGECNPMDFMSVQWRITAEGEVWQPLMERVARNDLPGNLLAVEQLDAYETYEFRAVLHHVKGAQIATGYSTGALMPGMLQNEMVKPPQVTASGSASFDVVLPAASPCRDLMQVSIEYSSERSPDQWQSIPRAGVRVEERTTHLDALHCLGACYFRYVPTNIIGWEVPSEASEPVRGLPLPELSASSQRVEIRLAAHKEWDATPTDWEEELKAALSSALDIPPTINIAEVRNGGEYVVIDLPHSNSQAGSDSIVDDDAPMPATPTATLAALIQQPACESNLALQQSSSASCTADGASASNANDGDLHQFAPHTWVACGDDNGNQPWWSVQLFRDVTRPFVRIFVGECCAQSFQGSLEILIGSAPGTGSKCATLQVHDGTMAGAFCDGTGSVITVRASSNFALAEVQVCEASTVNQLLSLPLTSTVDASAGVTEIGSSHATQLVPALLSLSEPGRSAPWRLPAPKQKGTSTTEFLLVAVAGASGMIFMGLVACYCFDRAGASRKRGKKKFARVSASEGGRCSELEDDEESDEDEDDEDDEDDDYRNDEHQKKALTWNKREHAASAPRLVGSGTMPLSIERADGAIVSAIVNLTAIEDMEQIFNVVKSTVETALGAQVDHFALQYRNEKNQFEEAYYDPILGEGSEVRDVISANQWRVLVLGEVASVLRDLPSDSSIETSRQQESHAGCYLSDGEPDEQIQGMRGESSAHVHL